MMPPYVALVPIASTAIKVSATESLMNTSGLAYSLTSDGEVAKPNVYHKNGSRSTGGVARKAIRMNLCIG